MKSVISLEEKGLPLIGTASAPQGVRIDVRELSSWHRNGTRALDQLSFTIEPGKLTAIIGPSGAGKTTLLKALAEIAPAQRGTVTMHADPAHDGTSVGFVPQDDILHRDLPLRRTLQHAAALRIDASRADIDVAVRKGLETLGLAAQSDLSVGSLSGGQRKRASIASEILTRPGVCLLDEPTSGLDPAAAAEVIVHLGRMAADGTTVVFTTHSIEDIERSDQVLVLARGGRLVATGTRREVLDHLNAKSFTELYERIALDQAEPSRTPGGPRVAGSPAPRSSSRPAARANRPGAARQWWILTRRSIEILARDRLTLAILMGSPAAVIAMFAVLFRSGSFDVGEADGSVTIQVAYWLSFAGFFFGLTFALLQICTEIPVLRGERHAGVRTGAYLGSKLAVLTPVLLFVNVAMITVLETLHRIPDLSPRALAELYTTMSLNALAALCLGLVASAVVTSTAQAALALPMLCFPAVLFSGAIVPMPVMATVGRLIGAVMPDRWAFEAIAGQLGVAGRMGPASPYASLGASAVATYWSLLALFATVLGSAAYVAILRRSRSN